MGVLDQINQMRSQGVNDEEIVRKLQEQGISPKSINDALNQEEIKKAVGGEDYEENESSQIPSPTGQYVPKAQEMDENYGDYNYGNEAYSPQTQPQTQGYEEYYPQQEYDDYGYGAYNEGGYGGSDTNTIMEISEQVFSEKIQKIQKQVKELTEFKTLTESKVETIADRLKRLESVIDKLQTAILEKIGGYGRNLESIKKEMAMMQDSFGKALPSLASKHEHKTSKETKTHKKTKKTKKGKRK